MALVKKAPDLAALALEDDVVLIAVPRSMADGFTRWSEPMQFRLGIDNRHPRLRTMTVRLAPVEFEARDRRR